MPRRILVDYSYESTFKIPKNIPLLSQDDNEKITGDDIVPWSWWVKWDTIYYYNDKKEECKLEPHSSASKEGNFKRPSYIYDDDDSDEEDENSYKKKGTESEHYCDWKGHENIKLLNDGDGGWYCEECDSEDLVLCDKHLCKEIANYSCDPCGMFACMDHTSLCKCGKYIPIDSDSE